MVIAEGQYSNLSNACMHPALFWLIRFSLWKRNGMAVAYNYTRNAK
jgi:hypothetical protein